MYKVIKAFSDLKDNNNFYNVGDVYPREGLEVKPERIEELSGSNNKQGAPLIEKIKPEAEKPEAPKASKKTAAK
jgi:hypothetical protein